MRNECVLVVDDTSEVRLSMADLLREEGFSVDTASDGQEAIDILKTRFFDIVLTDLSMPRKDGMEVLKSVIETSPETICIIITGYGTIKNAVEAIRLGAYDYLTKPVKADEVLVVMERALDIRNLRRENRNLKKQLRTRYGFDRIVGKSDKMQKVFDLIEKVADTESTVLITGESGTGKELIAHAIHYVSERRDQPFVPINCSAIPEELLESELFGHEKGAFTHAIRTRIGRFELANHGAIFLDEIGEMSPALQVKLLRVLQERTFERVGGVKTIEIDIRVLAATNVDLEEAVRQGRFREDLFYRLNVIPINVPPLRERRDDIPLLIQHFLENFKTKKGVLVEKIESDAIECLCAYDWPGNVRELENMIERLVILANNPIITINDLPEHIIKAGGHRVCMGFSVPVPNIPDEGLSLSKTVAQMEKALILQALDKTGWIKNRAAKLLKMNRTTLIEKMKKQKLMIAGQNKNKKTGSKKSTQGSLKKSNSSR